MKSNIKSKKGFTIIELLVVIVVIGILAAISIVSYSGLTGKARATQVITVSGDVRTAASATFAEVGYYPATKADIQKYVTLPATVGYAATPLSPASGTMYISYRACRSDTTQVTSSNSNMAQIKYVDGNGTTQTITLKDGDVDSTNTAPGTISGAANCLAYAS